MNLSVEPTEYDHDVIASLICFHSASRSLGLTPVKTNLFYTLAFLSKLVVVSAPLTPDGSTTRHICSDILRVVTSLCGGGRLIQKVHVIGFIHLFVGTHPWNSLRDESAYFDIMPNKPFFTSVVYWIGFIRRATMRPCGNPRI